MGLFTNKKLFIIILSIIFIGIVLVPIVTIYFLNNGNPYEKYIVNKYIPAHLEKSGYTDDDIIKQSYIQPKHGINNSVYHGHYMVVFKDEPQLEYLYGVKKRGKKVVQFCEKKTLIAENTYQDMTTEKTNHSEKECIGYLDNRR
ncbi:DUF3139 domain-containing protein [Halalkalibacter alkalisediminis]|uniref:DUF3139 domain-containing protein n=1 Tax=Halalkalibacter alkalisediminis TaxID=935616 RepID=A0ABV6NL92_9BACI|nr:DUF3139 domain-containing protein [Halalkalibacter alkalisediminis]